MEIFDVKEKLPNHKDLVLVKVNDNIMPSIYYTTLGGFYHYSLFYHTHEDNVYKKARIKPKWEIKNVENWCLMPSWI